jgi:D-xylose transport system substrate-binding protein
MIICVFMSCKNEGRLKVAFLVPNLKAERYSKEKIYFTDKMRELGYEVEFANADYDQNVQLNQVTDFLNQGIKVLVVSAVNVYLAARIVREAHEYHAIVIAYDRLIKNADLDYYVSFQYQVLGQEMAQYIVNSKPNGKFVVVGGDKTDFNAIQINKGLMKVLEPLVKDNKIQILYNVFIEDWTPENAAHEINYFLDLSDQTPDAIICSSDKMANGVIKALEKHDLAGKVLLTGMDAEKTSCRNILSGKQTMTVYKPFKILATNAAEVAAKCIRGDKIETTDMVWNGNINVPSILVKPIPVDKNNLKSTVIADGLHLESEIYETK